MALEKVKIKNLDTNETFDALFNPTEYTVQKNVSWDAPPVVGKNVPPVSFKGGGARTLKMDLLFDSNGESVLPRLNKLYKLTETAQQTQNAQTRRSRPPFCLFTWGSDWQFKAVVTTLSVKYTLFNESGAPLRAMASVTFQEVDEEKTKKKQNPTSFTPAPMKRRKVRPGDTLGLIAFEEYHDATQWRRIADANQLDDPMHLSAGDVLAIPSLN